MSTERAELITDFSHAQGDRIDLATIDAIAGGANDAFHLIAGSFSGAAGELRFSFSGGNTLIEVDVTGDGAADLAILVAGHISFTAADFVL